MYLFPSAAHKTTNLWAGVIQFTVQPTLHSPVCFLQVGTAVRPVSVHTTGFTTASWYWLCGLRAFCANTLLTHLTHSCIQRHWFFIDSAGPPPFLFPFLSVLFLPSPFPSACLISFRRGEKGHLAKGRRETVLFVHLSTRSCSDCQHMRLDPSWESGRGIQLARLEAPGFLWGTGRVVGRDDWVEWDGGVVTLLFESQTHSPLSLVALIPKWRCLHSCTASILN